MPELQRVLEIAIPSILFFLMLIVGMDLTLDDFRKVRRSPRSFLVGTLCQYLIPLAALATLYIVKPAPEIISGLALLASAPAGGVSNFYAYLARANVALSVVLTATSCILAAVTMPILVKFFERVLTTNLPFQIPFNALFVHLVVMLAIPVVLGILFRHFFPFLTRYGKIFRLIGTLLVLALVVFVLLNTLETVRLQWRQICVTSFVFVVISMLIGYLSSQIFRLNKPDGITLVIEFGVRNAAIATTAAVVFLKRTEFATLAATYFVIEALLIISAVMWIRRAESTS